MRAEPTALSWILSRVRDTGSLSGFARGVGITFTIQIAGVGAAYFLQVFLARWMGAVEYGKFAYVFSWVTLLSVLAGLGLDTALLRFIPQYRASKEPGLMRGMMKWSRQRTLGAGLVIALLACGTAAWFAPPQYSTPLMLGVWMIPLVALMNLYTGASRALRRVAIAFVPSLVGRPLLLLGGACILFLLHGRIDSRQVLIVALGTVFLVVVFQGLVVRRDLFSWVEDARLETHSGEWSRVAIPLLLSSGFGMLITQAGVLMVGTISGPAEAGIYNAAIKTALLINFIVIAVNTFAAPMFAALHSQGRHDELQQLLTRAAHMMFWPSLAIAAVMLAFSGTVLGLFGQEFVAARAAMAVLIGGQLVNAGVGVAGRLTDLTGHQRRSAWIRGASAALTVLLGAVLIPFFGVLGAAIASASALSASNIWLHRLAVRNLGMRPSILFALFGRRRGLDV